MTLGRANSILLRAVDALAVAVAAYGGLTAGGYRGGAARWKGSVEHAGTDCGRDRRVIVAAPMPTSGGNVAVLIFIWSIAWGSLSAQFFVQTVASLIIALIFSTGLAFSKVAKSRNTIGFGTSAAQVLLFGALFQGGNWLSSYVIDYGSWNATSIAGLLSFLFTFAYCIPQVPGKLLLARMSAWRPYFAEASMAVPASERVEFARKCKAEDSGDPTAAH